jgi:glycerol-3-phosphate dehydrogenase (NAD(P)+)
MREQKIGIIGAGSWGTTLANLLADKGFEVTLWVYEEELLEKLKSIRCNTRYLPGITLNAALRYTRSLKETVYGKHVILWVTPSQVFRKLFSEALPFFSTEAIQVSASKGIENESLKRLSEIAEDQNPAFRDRKFVVLSGPSFAMEVCRKLPTAVVVASRDRESAASIQEVMATPLLRIYTSQDIVGVELGGALKNVIAVATGIADGLGYGSNTRAALITRGLAEMMRLGVALGAEPITFSGLSGLGDLVLTCTSTMSRNYSVGFQIGQGKAQERILQEMNAVAEGVFTTRSAFFLAQSRQVAMPITQVVYQVLYENKPAPQAVQDLMGRELKQETPL